MPKMFICACLKENGEMCSKSFKTSSDLDRHECIHYGIKKYVCGECNKSFIQPCQLKTHHISLHTTERPYKCDQCLDTFPDPSSCTRHRKEQHEGTYICPLKTCKRRISRKAKFKIHLAEHRCQFSGDDVENYYERYIPPRPKRAKMRKPKVESPHVSIGLPSLSIDPQLSVPFELCPTDPDFFSSQTPVFRCSPLPSPTPAHSYPDSESPLNCFVDFNYFNLNQGLMLQGYNPSFPPICPPSLSSSLSSSPESGYLPLREPHPSHATTSEPLDKFYTPPEYDMNAYEWFLPSGVSPLQCPGSQINPQPNLYTLGPTVAFG